MAHFTLKDAHEKLASAPEAFVELFKHGSLLIEYYKPAKVDKQTTRTRDRVYMIASGSGQFVNGPDTHAFGPGDVLFVPAKQEHRFVDFTEDFAAWVIFYGPEGGEPAQPPLSAEEQMALYEESLKETDWGHQPC
ncbi:MAG: hypothetical protein L7V86_02455 [Verrucomicrobiales bacterium]|nr:hypothetical protein [Verrucomicrobiales bacterium]